MRANGSWWCMAFYSPQKEGEGQQEAKEMINPSPAWWTTEFFGATHRNRVEYHPLKHGWAWLTQRLLLCQKTTPQEGDEPPKNHTPLAPWQISSTNSTKGSPAIICCYNLREGGIRMCCVHFCLDSCCLHTAKWNDDTWIGERLRFDLSISMWLWPCSEVSEPLAFLTTIWN